MIKLICIMSLFTAASSHAQQSVPIVIGHRGASGYRPEHTLEAYKLAIEQGADFIEPDLVTTKDGVLIARHENEISGTTNVAEKFPDRKKTKMIDGEKIEGWFTEDFTLSEIKTLKAKERLSFRDQSYNGKFDIVTFDEILRFVSDQQKSTGRTIGLIPELKHPTYFKSIGLALEPKFIEQVKKAGLDKATSPLIVQCFELTTLAELKKSIGSRLFFLLEGPEKSPYDLVAAKTPKTYGHLTQESELPALAKIVYGVGPEKSWLINADGTTNGKVELFHRFNLKVIPYTFRKEEQYVSAFAQKDSLKEIYAFLQTGIDGLFSDFPDTAVGLRNSFLSRRSKK